ncbi:MAG: radical SAM protein [Thermoleophilia bacterium]
MSGVAGDILRLTPDCSPKLLEEPCLYNRATDELYVLNPEGIGFLAACGSGAPFPEASGGTDGPARDTAPDTAGDTAAFIEFCLEEGILEKATAPAERPLYLAQSPLPSLRYLLLHITDRCNLRCRHCFIGEPGSRDLPLEEIAAVVDEFESMQGLRLLVSGGEPLLHRGFWELNDSLAGRDLRSVLLSNGTLIDDEAAGRLSFQEVQISLDGMRAAHDFIRGAGSFERSLAAIGKLTAAGKQVSVATMVHERNLGDFDRMEALIAELGVEKWEIDLPSASGRLTAASGLMVDARTAGPYIDRSFGGAIHEPAAGYACGAHLMAVMAGGDAARCGFYADQPVGSVTEGLAACWQKIRKIRLSELDCDCDFIEDCRGGCRFRAAGYNSPTGADLCQCYRYGAL